MDPIEEIEELYPGDDALPAAVPAAGVSLAAIYPTALAAFVAERDDDTVLELDDLVHELKSVEATNVNNAGTAAQVAYLVESLGGPDVLMALLPELFPPPPPAG